MTFHVNCQLGSSAKQMIHMECRDFSLKKNIYIKKKLKLSSAAV